MASHLVGGHVYEAFDAVLLCGLDEHVRPHHIILREGKRVAERVVDVCLSCCVDDRIDALGLKHVSNEIGRQDVALDELEVRAVFNCVQVREAAAIVQLVEADNLVLRILLNKPNDDVRRDKAGAASNKDVARLELFVVGGFRLKPLLLG